jgi:hypothetical protein
MTAISIRQPWASLIATGKKTIETRTWPTKHRGPLLICVSQSPKRHGLPTGVALAIADVIDCRPMTKADEPAACCDIYPKAWSWVLANVRAIDHFKVKGQLGLFKVELPATQIF